MMTWASGSERKIGRGRRDGDAVAELPRLSRKRHRHRTCAENDQRRMRQHRFDENVHGPLARAHVLREAHAVAVFAGLDAEFGKQIFRLHRDHARLAVGERVAGGLQHRATGAAAADPPCHDGPVRADDRLGAGLRRGHRHRANHGGQDKCFLGGLEPGHQVHHFHMLGHRRVSCGPRARSLSARPAGFAEAPPPRPSAASGRGSALPSTCNDLISSCPKASPDKVRARSGFSACWRAHRDRHAAARP